MKITELYEGAEPKLPGAVSGIKIMTPQQFVNDTDDLDENDKKIAGRYDPDQFDSMVKRVGQLAKQGPRKTVYDPIKRVYKTVPVNQNKKDVGEDIKQVDRMHMDDYIRLIDKIHDAMMQASQRNDMVTYEKLKQKYIELENRAKKGLIPEATKLPASQREFGGQEFQDYMKRIKGTDDIDKKTGQVYKSASWKTPAKGVRYDLRIIEQREWLFKNADWAGSYLYAK